MVAGPNSSDSWPVKTIDCGTGSRGATTPIPSLTERLSTPFGDEHGAPLRLRGGVDGHRLVFVVGGLTLLAICGAVLAPFDTVWRIVLLLGAFAAAWREARFFLKRMPMSEFSLRADGACLYCEAAGVTWKGQVEPGGWQSGWIVLVHLRVPFGRLSVPVLRGRQRPGEFRRLRVWLKHRLGRHPED